MEGRGGGKEGDAIGWSVEMFKNGWRVLLYRFEGGNWGWSQTCTTNCITHILNWPIGESILVHATSHHTQCTVQLISKEAAAELITDVWGRRNRGVVVTHPPPTYNQPHPPTHPFLTRIMMTMITFEMIATIFCKQYRITEHNTPAPPHNTVEHANSGHCTRQPSLPMP